MFNTGPGTSAPTHHISVVRGRLYRALFVVIRIETAPFPPFDHVGGE